MFDILSEKAGYKTMYSNISFVQTVFKCRKNDLQCMYIEILTVVIFR